MTEKMKITWLGHSCFKAESQNYTVIFDPYENGYVPGLNLAPQEADLVLCSHDHADHNARTMVNIRQGKASPFRIQTIFTYHDNRQGALRGKNTIHILDDGTFRIAHAGDLGCELLPNQKELLKNLDLLMLPIGGYYTIDANQAKQLAEDIKPKVTVPMHYRGPAFGFDVLSTLNDYTDLCDDVVYYNGNTLELTKDTLKQTAVFRRLRGSVSETCKRRGNYNPKKGG